MSAYTKDNSPTATMKLLKDSDALYADKDKTASLLHTVGFHNAYRIEQSGYIGNISYGHNYVNVSGKKFSDVFAETAEQNQLRTQTYSDREVLEMAYDNVNKMKLSESERSALDIYKKRLDKLKDLEQRRDGQKEILSELNENPEANADEIQKTKSRISTYSKMAR